MNDDELLREGDEREGGSNGPKGTLGGPKETKKPKVDNPRELDDARFAALIAAPIVNRRARSWLL